MRENKALGLILTGDSGEGLGELCRTRTLASVPFGGRYRVIDFMLTNMMYAGIYDVGILTKSKYESLMAHVGSGRVWDMARKNGGLVLLPPNVDNTRQTPYDGAIQLLYNYRNFIKEAKARYVLLCDADIVGQINFDEMIEQHTQSGAQITLGCQPVAKNAMLGAITQLRRRGNRVTDVLINSVPKAGALQYMGIMVIEKRTLLDLIEDLNSHSQYCITKHLVQGRCKQLDMRLFEISGCVKIDSLQNYYRLSMSMLKKEARTQFFDPSHPVLTRVRDEVPVRYGEHAIVKNSLIADGCIIEGTVENCVLFRKVKVAKGVSLKDCIIMEGCEIGENSSLRCVIADRRCRIGAKRMLAGQQNYPVVIEKESVI